MAQIDKKAYDMVLQSWILHCFKIYEILDKVIKFIDKTMETWRVELTAGGKSLAEVKRGIFQRDALSPITICNRDDVKQSHSQEMHGRIYSVNHKKRSTTQCKWTTSNCLPKKERELETLILRYLIWHRKMWYASNEKWQTIHDRKSQTSKSSSNQNARRKANLQILGNIGNWHHQRSGDERKKLKKSISGEPKSYLR